MANVPNGWPPAYTSCSGCQLGATDPATLVKFGGTQTDAFGRLGVSNPFTLFDSHQRYALDDNFISNVATVTSIPADKDTIIMNCTQPTAKQTQDEQTAKQTQDAQAQAP